MYTLSYCPGWGDEGTDASKRRAVEPAANGGGGGGGAYTTGRGN